MLKTLKNVWKAIPMLLGSTISAFDEAGPIKEEIETKISKIFLTTMQSQYDNLKLFSINNDSLGREVAAHLDIRLGRMICSSFNDGEVKIEILDSVRGHRIFILKTFDPKSPNDGIMQLLLTVACAKNNGASQVTVILPYFPYTLPSVVSSEEINEGRDYYTSFGSDIVKMLEEMGCDSIVSLNVSMTSPKGFAHRTNFIHLIASELVVPQIIRERPQNLVLVASKMDKIHFKNVTSLKNAFGIFKYDCGLGFFHRPDYIGDSVANRDVLLFTNVLRNTNKIIAQSQALKKQGARNIYCFGFHGVCSSDQFQQIMKEGAIKELILTNSVAYQENKNIKTVSIAKLIAEVIAIMQQEKALEQFRRDREMLNYFYLQKMQHVYAQQKRQNKEGEKKAETSKNTSI